MRTYEALYIIVPEMEEDGIRTVANGVEKLVTDQGGTIVRSEIWGKRKLAQKIGKYSEGNYVLLRFQAEPEFIGRLENFFKLDENIFRYLTLHLDAQTLRLEAEQENAKERELRSGRPGGPGHDDSDDDDDYDRPRRPSRSRRREEDDDDDDDEENTSDVKKAVEAR